MDQTGWPMALLSNDLPLVDTEHAPPGRLAADQARAVGAVDDARPDR
jgi:serine/threonine-protein kinase HipA